MRKNNKENDGATRPMSKYVHRPASNMSHKKNTIMDSNYRQFFLPKNPNPFVIDRRQFHQPLITKSQRPGIHIMKEKVRANMVPGH